MFKLELFSCNITARKLISDTINNGICVMQVAGFKNYYPPEPIDKSDWPEFRKLRPVAKQPDFSNRKPPKIPKMIQLMRGPEPVHNELLYKGFGIKALLGGRLKFEHFETIRVRLNRKIIDERMFALWRVDDPWQPVGKRGTGKRMGCGKSAIHHYVTPVKAGRIILEIGGDIDRIEAIKMLGPIAEVLPFPARVVDQKYLENEKKESEWIKENNLNPFTMEYIIKNNMGGCHNWLSKYDHIWFGKYK